MHKSLSSSVAGPPVHAPRSAACCVVLAICCRSCSFSWHRSGVQTEAQYPARCRCAAMPGSALMHLATWETPTWSSSVRLATRHHSSAFALIPCRAVVGECNGHTSQLWIFDTGSYKIQYFANPSKCLDAGDMKDGTEIKICACTARPLLQPWPTVHAFG